MAGMRVVRLTARNELALGPRDAETVIQSDRPATLAICPPAGTRVCVRPRVLKPNNPPEIEAPR